MPSRSHRSLVLLVLCLGLVLISGCGYPAATPENLGLITSLRTALSARNVEWLDANEQKIEARRLAGQMTDDEYETFQSIVAEARRGDWESAERAAVKFQRAQRPTDEQIRAAEEREEKRKLK